LTEGADRSGIARAMKPEQKSGIGALGGWGVYEVEKDLTVSLVNEYLVPVLRAYTKKKFAIISMLYCICVSADILIHI
jgi:hypothetical protein